MKQFVANTMGQDCLRLGVVLSELVSSVLNLEIYQGQDLACQ